MATEPGGDGQVPVEDVGKDKLIIIDDPMQRKGSKDSTSGRTSGGETGSASGSSTGQGMGTAKDGGRLRICEEGKGAYEFVAKERLLGIYLCVYVWRGCKHLVKSELIKMDSGLYGLNDRILSFDEADDVGWATRLQRLPPRTSRPASSEVDSVTRAASVSVLLQQYRVSLSTRRKTDANLGSHPPSLSPSLGCMCLAIAIHLAETRLLFINSHLAAHASRCDVRLMNVQKIKSELDVDAFLDPGDERLIMEGVSRLSCI